MSITHNIATGLFVAGLFAASLPAVADVAVVVSATSPAKALTEEQAADIFLGKATALPGGGQAVPVDQADGSPLKEQFYSKVAGKNGAQLKAYWSKQIFSGKGQPPKDVGDSAGVKALVATNPNIVGYIDKSAVDATVKVLLTIK